ncbi:hypothetical protein [Ruegeria sp. THAF33]|uniref:hypothetical protein n=1 Tax=Ruegeria sp. THAF33 TaxID=2587853 RepID=UPI00126901C0|nr:hypothetical protein [Ruegeria sp. THAF33]QFT71922.1 hypothetical protein FIU92_02715 [Ruegeria sp. THAF33]
MKLWTPEQKTLFFNRVGYVALFMIFLVSSGGSGFAEEKLGLKGVFFFPLDALVFPVIMASLVQTLLWSKRLTQANPNATLWYNATYMVGLSLSVFWAAQISVLVYGFGHWHRIDFWDLILRNVFLLFWAGVATAICRAVLGQAMQTKQTLFGEKRN